MPAPLYDPQRQKLYQLEAEFGGACQYTSCRTADLQRMVRAAARYYMVRPPKLRVVRSDEATHSGWYEDEPQTIVLNRCRDGANGFVLLHEFAHYLVDVFWTDVEDHGPEFCALYMHLLDHFAMFPQSCFRLLAKQYGVKLGRRYRPMAFR